MDFALSSLILLLRIQYIDSENEKVLIDLLVCVDSENEKVLIDLSVSTVKMKKFLLTCLCRQ
jgi:hypothetical protein